VGARHPRRQDHPGELSLDRAPARRTWDQGAREYQRRMDRAAAAGLEKVVPAARVAELLSCVLASGDRICVEGNNQKHADFLSEALARLDPEVIHGLHVVQSNIALASHLDLFERGIARRLDFCYSGEQGVRMARLVKEGRIEIGAIHTYLELYSRYFADLTPRVCFIAAQSADAEGNLYTGPNTEDTPAVVEGTAFKNGIVVAQVDEVVERLPRVDVPAGWVSFVVPAPRPHYIEPIFTRDPANITEVQILMAMMVIKGLYGPYEVTRLNHGIGFDTAAIELILPTYAESLGLRGRICRFMSVNPCPTLIPAIESGFVESIHCAGSELGMEAYTAARPDVFFNGRDGSMRSNRVFCQLAGHYADLFIGSTLQVDVEGNSSTATASRIAGFGGAPNFGSESRGRRHESPAWLRAGRESARPGGATMPRGRKLVVQMVETFREKRQPTFVERLDAWKLMEEFSLGVPPVMVYGDDMTHLVTEEGIAHLHRCATLAEREQAIRNVAGYTAVGLARDRRAGENLRDRGIVQRPEDLVRWSGGLYDPPSRFRHW
jgi:malonate decarboxylase alpha subunit